MATLEYAVTNQEIATTKTAELVKNTIGFYTVKFTFTGSVWTGLSERWAVFDPDIGESYKTPLDGNGECDIPGEVMSANSLLIGVYGVADGIEYPTIWTSRKWLKEGAYEDCPVSDYPEPSPVIETLQEEIDELTAGKVDKPENATEGNVAIIGSNQNIADSGISKDNLLIAPQLASNNYKIDSIPYKYRQTGGGIGVGNREYDSIVGGTIVSRQLYNITRSSGSGSGTYFVNNNDGSVTFYTDPGGATQTTTWQIVSVPSGALPYHVYLIGGNVPNASQVSGSYIINDFSAGICNYNNKQANIVKRNYYTPANLDCRVRIMSGAVITTPVTVKLYCYDLTLMLGSAIADQLYAMETAQAGSGVAVLDKVGLNQYRPYTATPSLESVSGLQSHIMTGFNAWDEQWESGDINIVDGAKRANASRSRSKNFIPVFPNTTYYCKTKYSNTIMCFYDADKHWVSAESGVGYVAVSNSTFVTPSWCYYMLFYYTGTTNEEFCINISDPVRNGTYEPYEEHTYPLDSSLTLLGVAVIDDNNNIAWKGDTYAPDGTVTRRYGIVTFDGSENWTNVGGSYPQAFQLSTGITNANQLPQGEYHALSNLYPYIISNSSNFGFRWQAASSGGIIFVYDENYSSNLAGFKAHLQATPMTLVYDLKTPTTETAEPYESLQICDPLGTEEYVTTGIVPVGHVTQYPEDAVKKLSGLPSDFSTLIAPTEVTYKATRAYTTGRLLIVNNVLYKATTSIASGATLTVGTNIVATTLDEVIASL